MYLNDKLYDEPERRSKSNDEAQPRHQRGANFAIKNFSPVLVLSGHFQSLEVRNVRILFEDAVVLLHCWKVHAKIGDLFVSCPMAFLINDSFADGLQPIFVRARLRPSVHHDVVVAQAQASREKTPQECASCVVAPSSSDASCCLFLGLFLAGGCKHAHILCLLSNAHPRCSQNAREVKIIRQYHIQKPEDYRK